MSPAAAAEHPEGPTLVGRRLGGCRLVQLIGQGGMGQVYEAIQESLNRRVAVKVLPPELASDGAFIKRFEREAGTLARLSHPNIVAIYDRGHVDGLYFFVLEYVEGRDGGPAQTLHRRLRSGKKLTIAEAAKLILQIGEALAYAHEKGVIHRDIKPSNVLLDARDNARLLDFGIAHLIGARSGGDARLTMTGEVLGTAGYVAPEQREGKGEIDARADIYSCGVLCYEMLTGRLPEGAFELPSEVVPGLDESWNVLVEKALQRNPDRRFQRMSEFVEAVHATTTATADKKKTPIRVRTPVRPAARPPTSSQTTPIVGKCPKCNTLNPGENRFCTECGAPMYEACPACKEENRVGTKYCGKCGADVLKLKRIAEHWRAAIDCLSRAQAVSGKEAKALVRQARDGATKLLAESPADEEAKKFQAAAEMKYRDLLLSDAEELRAQAFFSKVDPIPCLTQAYATMTEAQGQLPEDDKVKAKLSEVKSELRNAFLDRASALDGSGAMSLLQQMLQLLPDDTEARTRLDRLNAGLAEIKSRAQQLLKEGHFHQATEELAAGCKKFPEDKALALFQTEAQEGQEKLLKLAEGEIPLLWDQRRFVRMLEKIDELSKLRTDVQGLEEAKDQATMALSEAREISEEGDAYLAVGKPQEALECYEKAIALCADLFEATFGIEKARLALEAAALKRRNMKLACAVVAMIAASIILTIAAISVLERVDYSNSMAKALAAEQRNDWETAKAAYDKALQIKPGDQKARQQRDAVIDRLPSELFARGKAAEKTNYVEAVKWYRKAAEQNYAPAQYNLGVCYANGQGVAKDEVEAVKWYRKAAEQNDADGSIQSGRLLRQWPRRGEG